MDRQRELRDNLLVTAGTRAAYMDSAKKIELPSGTAGEDELARFISKVCDLYIDEEFNVSFDIYIESMLLDKYGVGGVPVFDIRGNCITRLCNESKEE